MIWNQRGEEERYLAISEANKRAHSVTRAGDNAKTDASAKKLK
jgi:hypothetical protein